MRKIPVEFENQIDNLCIEIGDILSERFRSLKMTANQLTTISLITGLISIYLFKKRSYYLSGTLFFISYMFDCFDGFYARKYDQVSDFGDLYDHAKDVIVFSMMAYLLYQKYRGTCHIPILVILGILTLIQLGCQEHLRKGVQKEKKGQRCLSITKLLCPFSKRKEIEGLIKIVRYFGNGTLMAYVTVLIYLLAQND